MKLPNWQEFTLNPGVLAERSHDRERIALWAPGPREGGFQHWQRVSTVARAEITNEQGVGATAANVIRARERVQGFLGRMLGRLRGGKGEPTWMLPGGRSAEQIGERQTDVILVWGENAAAPLDEAGLKARWPASTRVEQLGVNLFVVFGVAPAAGKEAAPLPTAANPREAAEQLLSAADKAADLGKRATALTDLGVALVREGDFARSAAVLEEALAIARNLQDRTRERDVLGNLGLALAGSQPQRAQQLFEEELASAKEAGDRFGEKNALTNLGMFFASYRNPGLAYEYFENAAALANTLGDRQHEAEMLWQMAIQLAELGQRDQLIAKANAAIDLLKSLGKPQAKVLADHLQKYLNGETLMAPGAGGAPGTNPAAAFGGAIVAGGWSPLGPTPVVQGPGLLRMAFSVTKSMARFLGSGMKRVTADVQQKRLRTCATCEHHTGVRCKLCGCFTNVKAWLPHEDCPINKWPKVG